MVQTIGRAARNAEGTVIMYADTVTPSMEYALMETERRRAIQEAYNAEHGIVPKTIVKEIAGLIEISKQVDDGKKGRRLSKMEREQIIVRLTREMKEAAKLLEFEHAAFLRDRIEKLRRGDLIENEPEKSEAQPHRRRGQKNGKPGAPGSGNRHEGDGANRPTRGQSAAYWEKGNRQP